MAHNITERDGMFTVREAAWHGLGTVLGDYPTREEAQQIAHPWEPVTEPIYRAVPTFDTVVDEQGNEETVPRTEYQMIEDNVAIVRSDNGGDLGVVSDTYTLISNTEMYDVAEALQGEGAQVRFETGGSLKGGRKVWLLLRLNEPLVIPGDPNGETIPYYALQNSHDGSGSFRGQATMTRIVCDNTAQFADLDASRRGTEFVFRHTANVKDRIDEAKQALAGWRSDVQKWNDLMRHLITVPVTREQRQEFVEAFIPAPAANIVSDRVRTNIDNARRDFYEVLGSETTREIAHTAYGLLQASVEYSEHYRRTKGTSDEDRRENRFNRAYLTRNGLVSQASRILQDVVPV